jgi:hypothetical protein
MFLSFNQDYSLFQNNWCYSRVHPSTRAQARICMSVCTCVCVGVCVYEVAHLHLMALMNFPVPLTWWVPTHVWVKGWKRPFTSTECHLIIAYQSTPALVLQLGVIKFPFDFPQRVKTAVYRLSCWDRVTEGRDLFNLSKPSVNYK